MTSRLLIYCLMIVIASVGGGLLPLVRVVTHIRMQIYLSFSAGVMLGSALLHMLPEAAEIGGPGVVPWALPGLLTLFMIERFFSFHHHEIEDEKTDKQASVPDLSHHHDHTCGHHHDHGVIPAGLKAGFHWKAAAIGLTVHSLLGGVALASADALADGDSWVLAQGVFLATLLHKPADALTITSLMRHGKERSILAHFVNLAFALMIPAGALIFGLGQSQMAVWPKDTIQTMTAAALAFSSGTFLCISLSDLLPELHFHSHDRVKLSISLLAGVALMALVAVFGE
ncbi:MAG: ZIP family metal transporter [bacterium]